MGHYYTPIHTLVGTVWKFFAGNSGILLAIFLFGKNVLDEPLDYSIKIGASFFFAIFALRFILFLFQNTFQYLQIKFRESKYGNAIIFLKNAFAKVNHLKREQHDDEELIKTLKFLCDNIKEIFDNKNLCSCSVSIKVPVKGAVSEKTSVKNLCRDTINSESRDNLKYEKIDHTIIGNTAFQKVLNNVLRKKDQFHYINNDIASSSDYENTSKELYSDNK